jgi:hypothetical protein
VSIVQCSESKNIDYCIGSKVDSEDAIKKTIVVVLKIHPQVLCYSSI